VSDLSSKTGKLLINTCNISLKIGVLPGSITSEMQPRVPLGAAGECTMSSTEGKHFRVVITETYT